mmetsp:Transcript_16611/g.19213  ORF Transcript_16611/g.19213 Transcript_16611/m.19213 type:complete len:120 (+) Transcript_16611:87-446(+)
MLWNTTSLRTFMIDYSKVDTALSTPNYYFVKRLKDLFKLIDSTSLKYFTMSAKVYDLYHLRNLLQDSDESKNRFTMEEMADAGEAYGEILDMVFKDLAKTQDQDTLTSVVGLPLEKHYT